MGVYRMYELINQNSDGMLTLKKKDHRDPPGTSIISEVKTLL